MYKDYVLTMLFVKYLSDIYKSWWAEFERKYQGDQTRVDRALSRERFILPEVEIRNSKGEEDDRFQASFDSLYDRRDRSIIGELINVLLEHVEDPNKAKLHNVFLHDVESARIEWEDVIRHPLLLEDDALMKFDVVVANPPFSLDKYSYLASFDEIAENEFNLNIPRYVDTFEPAPEIDIPSVQKEIVELEQQLAETRKKMNGYLRELGLDEYL